VLAVLLFVAAVFSGGCARVTANFREVDPGAYYRSGQMDATLLDITLRWYGIKTVVNLRGESPDEAWYRREIAVCAERGVAHYDLDWTMKRPPEPESLQAFVGILAEAEGPFLVHCQGGTHRAAVAAACYRLLEGESVEEAREEFGLFFDDAPIGQLLGLYEESGLYAQGNASFEQWVFDEYPAQYAAHGFDDPAATAESPPAVSAMRSKRRAPR